MSLSLSIQSSTSWVIVFSLCSAILLSFSSLDLEIRKINLSRSTLSTHCLPIYAIINTSTQVRQIVKARYQFRFYPTDQQQQLLAQLFGCVRVVWNDALAICKKLEKLPSNNDLQKLVITQAKKTEERSWLSEVSNIPLQQSVADLGVAYKTFSIPLKVSVKVRGLVFQNSRKR